MFEMRNARSCPKGHQGEGDGAGALIGEHKGCWLDRQVRWLELSLRNTTRDRDLNTENLLTHGSWQVSNCWLGVAIALPGF